MKAKVQNLLAHKDKTMPVLSFPSTQLLGITVKLKPDAFTTSVMALTTSCCPPAAIFRQLQNGRI